ncbi:MAG: hypothetical protein IKO72_14665 [Kiritimatiellae bacterium]|nr:hypothetical protein [Kiritimatiellia bacterium]
MRKMSVAMGVCCLATAVAYGAVGVGENIINGDLVSDGIGGVLNWQVCRPSGAPEVGRLRETGPDGRTAVRLSGDGASFDFEHAEIRLAVGGRYRLKTYVRTHGLAPDARSEYMIFNTGWTWSGAAKMPADTGGKWVEIEWEGIVRKGVYAPDVYTCAFYFSKIPQGGYADISHPRLLACTEDAAAAAEPVPLAKPYRPRIVPFDPLLSEIDAGSAEMSFYFTGDLADPPERYMLEAEIAGRTAKAALGSGKFARVSFGRIPEGRHTLSVSIRPASGGDAVASDSYPATASTPARETPGRRLNNFVTELLRVPLADGEYSFSLARDRWVHVSFDKPYEGVTADIDGAANPNAVRVRADGASEVMRRLGPGGHTVTVRGVKGCASAASGVLAVRLVKVLEVNFGRTVYTPTDFDRFGAYNHDFYTRFGMYRAVNKAEYPTWYDKAHPEFPANLRDRGCETRAHMRGGSMQIRYDMDAYRAMFTNSVTWRMRRPIEIDENAISANTRIKYNAAELFWELGVNGGWCMDVNLEDAGRDMYRTPMRDMSELAAMVNSGNGTSYVVPEAYSYIPADAEACAATMDHWRKFANGARTLVPAAPSRFVYLMSGWVWPGVYTPWGIPETDIKAFYDDFIHMLATDPAFADVGGIGLSSPACDEETFRFAIRAMRHYCVEGSIKRLSERFGLKLLPGIMGNGDFNEGEDGLSGWTLAPAEPGSLARGSTAGLGVSAWGQLRRLSRFSRFPPGVKPGDAYMVFRKTATGVNRLVRRLVNLTPGRLYELTFCTHDLDDIETRKGVRTPVRMVRARIAGGEEIPELGFDSIGDPRKGPRNKVETVTHRIVFRALSTQAEAVFSDDGAPAEPGRRRVLNWVGARPFYCEDEAELRDLIAVGAARPKRKDGK